MSGIGKKSKLSGAQNKKNRLKREKARQKLSGSLDKFTIKTINPTTTPAEENQDLILETQSSSGVSINSIIENESKETEENQDLNPETPSSSSGVSINQEINKIDSDSEKVDFNDPATWPKQINIKLRNRLIENDTKHLILKDFPKNECGRKFSYNYYYRTLSNGEKLAGVICFIRKLII
ncbi:zinc finger MYM-type protein 5-like [Hydra vulgaris]|uniref:Zinc finger MYM-type protein 5-like n=1 Tax=Hydra vulgaris TaxID=6087 RepID=A0ABM4CAA3_HYDVU